uniref:Uncharacterized protein n=1 Tax=Lepeophtheirus salmonis TaxID=72036 RepID=A0A0K2T3G1_LEPSM
MWSCSSNNILTSRFSECAKETFLSITRSTTDLRFSDKNMEQTISSKNTFFCLIRNHTGA